MDPYETEVRDGMRIEWDVPIEMDDGVVLRADVFRPPDDGPYPVILSHGPYGKWLHFTQNNQKQWDLMVEKFPEVAAGSTNKYQNWETVDPEKWVPDGYAVVRVDSRGSGRSPGTIDPWSARETRDFAHCIEWAGETEWSNGNVGLLGISYYAMNQWQVAALQPDHLEAICIWEGAADWYRDVANHGGIYCHAFENWWDRRIESVQHGMGEKGYRSPMTGEWVAGPDQLTEEELGANRVDFVAGLRSSKVATGDFWTERTPDFSKIEVPLLSAGNWGGHGLHARGNFEGFLRAQSTEKWLEVHGGEHWTEFYTDYGRELQKNFFAYYLKNEDNGWDEHPPVQLQVRYSDGTFVERHEEDWPIPRTEWTRYYLHADGQRLSTDAPSESSSVTYDSFGDGLTFLSPPFAEETEFTGPISARMFISSNTEDADLFLVVRVFSPDMEEVVFQGALDPHKPIALGWLRASHRKLDEELSTKWRPYHTHDEIQPLEPGDVYELEVEILPTSIVTPIDSRIGLTVRGTDYEYPGDVEAGLAGFQNEFTGVGPYKHNTAEDRPLSTYDNEVTIYTGPEQSSSVLLPRIPDLE